MIRDKPLFIIKGYDNFDRSTYIKGVYYSRPAAQTAIDLIPSNGSVGLYDSYLIVETTLDKIQKNDQRDFDEFDCDNILSMIFRPEKIEEEIDENSPTEIRKRCLNKGDLVS